MARILAGALRSIAEVPLVVVHSCGGAELNWRAGASGRVGGPDAVRYSNGDILVALLPVAIFFHIYLQANRPGCSSVKVIDWVLSEEVIVPLPMVQMYSAPDSAVEATLPVELGHT